MSDSRGVWLLSYIIKSFLWYIIDSKDKFLKIKLLPIKKTFHNTTENYHLGNILTPKEVHLEWELILWSLTEKAIGLTW